HFFYFFFFQAEDGIRDKLVTGVQTCALPISRALLMFFELRRVLVEEHKKSTGSVDGLFIGLQLTHSGRFCRPNAHDRPEPRILRSEERRVGKECRSRWSRRQEEKRGATIGMT